MHVVPYYYYYYATLTELRRVSIKYHTKIARCFGTVFAFRHERHIRNVLLSAHYTNKITAIFTTLEEHQNFSTKPHDVTFRHNPAVVSVTSKNHSDFSHPTYQQFPLSRLVLHNTGCGPLLTWSCPYLFSFHLLYICSSVLHVSIGKAPPCFSHCGLRNAAIRRNVLAGRQAAKGLRWSTSLGMLRPQTATGGDGHQVWRVSVNVSNKRSWTADKEWLSGLGVGPRVDILAP